MTHTPGISRLHLASCLLAAVLLLGIPGHAFSSGLPAPGQEFPVVWWAQNHVKEALAIFQHTTWRTLGAACSSGNLPDAPGNSGFQNFIKDQKRRNFCRRYPGPTHHLLQEAPYFMVRPPGDQK